MDQDRERGAPEDRSGEGQAAAGGDQQKGSLTEEEEQAKEELRKIEDNPPEKLEDWPKGRAKYETFGGPEGQHSYHEGPEQNLGPDSVRHHEGGDVSIAGEKVENPEEFKGEPIPGGPTDPDSPRQPGERELQKEEGVTVDDPQPDDERDQSSDDS